MTITRVGFNSAATGGANLTIALPGGTAAGDVALMLITQRLSGGVCGTPTGWSIIPGFPFPPALNDGVQGFYKVLVGGDANPQSVFTNTSGQGVVGVLGVYRGVNTTVGPFALNAQGTSYGTAVGPQAVAANPARIANATIVDFIGHLYVSSAPTITNLNGFTNRQALGVGTSWPCHSTMLDKDITDAYNGWTGVTATANFNAWDVQIALIDAVQPNRFNLAQGSALTVIGRTDFPEMVLGTIVTGGSGTVVPIPVECQPGNVMVCVGNADNGTSRLNTPAGWTAKFGIDGPSGQRVDFFTRVMQVGDTSVTLTTAGGQGGVLGRILFWRNSRSFDKLSAGAGLTGNNSTCPTLSTIDDVYSEVIAVQYRGNGSGALSLLAGSEQGFVSRWSQGIGGFAGSSLIIASKAHFGASPQVGPTVTGTGFFSGGSYTFNIEAFYQPAPISASIHQGSTGSAAIHADQGYPIEVHIQQGSHVTADMKVAWPRHRKPQRELVWVKDYNGTQVMVVD